MSEDTEGQIASTEPQDTLDPAPQPDPAPEPVAAEPAEPSTDPAPADAKPDAEPKRTPWWQSRIDQITRQKYEEAESRAKAERERDALMDLLKAQGIDPVGAGTPPGAAPTPAPAPSNPTEFHRAVQQEAARVAAQQAFTAKCNDVYQKGVAQFPDFEESVAHLKQAGVMEDSFLEAALATEAPEAVLHRLGQDPAEAMRLAQLPPVQRGIQLDRMAREMAAPKSRAVSSAPAPIQPVGGVHASKAFDPSDTSIPMDEWMREMDKREAAKRARG